MNTQSILLAYATRFGWTQESEYIGLGAIYLALAVTAPFLQREA